MEELDVEVLVEADVASAPAVTVTVTVTVTVVGGGQTSADVSVALLDSVEVSSEVVSVVVLESVVSLVSLSAGQTFESSEDVSVVADSVGLVELPAPATLHQHSSIGEMYAALISSAVTSGTRRF